jgi:hypothetical protein
MPVAELEVRSEWQILTPKQQAFLRAYIHSGVTTGTYDAEGAVRSAYPNVTTNARIFSYEILANPKIDCILGLHFGWTVQDRWTKLKAKRRKSLNRLLRASRFHLNHAEPGSIAAQRLIVQQRGLILGLTPDDDDLDAPESSSAPAPTSKAFYVGQLVTHRDSNGVVHTGRVVSVDATGKPKIEDVAS